MASKDYGQKERMEDETMVSILEAQERAIWPVERPVLEQRLRIPGARVVDLGCGTGLVTARLAEMGAAEVVGIDLFEGHVERAQARFARPNLSFETGNAAATRFADDSFDVAVNRCVLQAVPDPEAIVAEMLRIVKPEGRVYFLAEDYGLILASDAAVDPQAFYLGTCAESSRAAGSDLRIGRRLPAILARRGCRDVTVDYLPLDTIRVPRKDLADVFRTWAAGYVDFIARLSGRPAADVRAGLEGQVEACLDPARYFVWLLPGVTARPPG